MDNPVRLHWLDPRDPEQDFPPPSRAMRNPNGLLAIGGNLTPNRLIKAYSSGIFPWFNPDEPILWWCPNPRAVLVPSAFHVSHSLAKRLRQGHFALTLDHAFPAVLEGCAGARAKSHGTWLGPAMRAAYTTLHEMGYAHSVEVWIRGELAGGLYGVALGHIFFGESMFSRATDASKIALYALSAQLTAWDFPLIDCQIASPHLTTLGVHSIPRRSFLAQVQQTLKQGARTGPWRFDVSLPGSRTHLPW
ncbi:MAG TPA: leucyl/phenylalanyl-tRNA--protein transferase [Nevskiaceae bacterium]|nr:leucyl/phenylalanyl-tRNA--protein transferase [Nevskiaceae bacterium]